MSGDNPFRQRRTMEAAGLVGDLAANLWGGMISAASREQNIRILGLVEQLGHSQFREREVAFTQLQRFGVTAAPILVEGLASPDVEARRRAIRLLSRLGSEAVPALIRGLRSENPQAREHTMYLLEGRVDELGGAPFPNRACYAAFIEENNLHFRPRPLSAEMLSYYMSKGPSMLAAMEAWLHDPANAATVRELRSIAAAGGTGGEASRRAAELINAPQQLRLNLSLALAQAISDGGPQFNQPQRDEMRQQARVLLDHLLTTNPSIANDRRFMAAVRYSGLMGDENLASRQFMMRVYANMGADQNTARQRLNDVLRPWREANAVP